MTSPTNAVWIGNIPFSMTEHDVRDHFDKFGRILTHKIVEHRSGRIALVRYAQSTFANLAVSAGNGMTVDGTKLRVKHADDEDLASLTAPPVNRAGITFTPGLHDGQRAIINPQHPPAPSLWNLLGLDAMGKLKDQDGEASSSAVVEEPKPVPQPPQTTKDPSRAHRERSSSVGSTESLEHEIEYITYSTEPAVKELYTYYDCHAPVAEPGTKSKIHMWAAVQQIWKAGQVECVDFFKLPGDVPVVSGPFDMDTCFDMDADFEPPKP
eukprot:TRINITY_DN103646_c0_g1_i1.p1 TRINITY_DN103646_c0_g1~~TRINITY_DN103646_c0_g1_i1.p1  ORF type:complete len:267 (-),score=19.25 TRINITY_DN103646_c0_g1_i1:95-895(-)